MIDWEYMATDIATEIHGNTELKMIFRYISPIFNKPLLNFAESFEDDERYITIYNFVMNISKIPGLTDDGKIEKIKKFAENFYYLFEFSSGKLYDIFLKAGYQDKKLEASFRITDFIESKGDTKYFDRNFHEEVVKHTKKLFSQKNYFHAILEATKAYNNKVKKLTNSDKDGATLMQFVFSENGNLKINKNQSESEKNEQKGIKSLSEGLISAFRNPTAHETALEWEVDKDDCLDILSLVSFLFKHLDNAIVTLQRK